MTSQEAKEILALYRPEIPDGDPALAAALELARRDPELGDWLEKSLALRRALSAKFRAIEPPPALEQNILAGWPPQKAASWRAMPLWLAAAAALVLCAGWLVFQHRQPSSPTIAQYRNRMVGSALKQYDLELRTNSLDALRSFAASKNAPADFVVPKRLEELPLTGGGVLSWQNHPVSMVCFDMGTNNMLYLFVIDSGAVGDAAPALPESAEMIKVSKLMTANWSEGNRTYLLAGATDPDTLRRYSAAVAAPAP